MSASAELVRLEAPMSDLRKGMDCLDGGGPSSRQVLRAIFTLNNELGRLARGEAGGDRKRALIVELQLRINALTREVKRGRTREAREAFAGVEAELLVLANEIR